MCNSKADWAHSKHFLINGGKMHVGGKETCSDAETVPSTAQYLPICCPLGHLTGCPGRNISKRDRKQAQENTGRTEVGTIGFQVWENKITVLESKEEEDAYLLHLKDLHSTQEEMGEGMEKK